MTGIGYSFCHRRPTAPALTEVGGNTAEEKAGAVNSAIRSSAAATPVVGAEHARPAARDTVATRPRAEETATDIGAAAKKKTRKPRKHGEMDT
jgi:hypothetical protein